MISVGDHEKRTPKINKITFALENNTSPLNFSNFSNMRDNCEIFTFIKFLPRERKQLQF